MVENGVSKTMRRLLLGVVLGILVFAGFSIFADVGKIRDRLGDYAWWTFAAALALALLNYGLRFVRWQLYLRQTEIKIAREPSALIFVSGFALSITPGKVGELIKSYLLRALNKTPITKSAPVVVAERVTDLAALVGLGLVGVALYGVATTTVAIGGVVLAIGLVILAVPKLAVGLINLLTRPSALRRFRSRLETFYRGLARLVRPMPLSWATALAAIAWLAECIGFALIANGFPGAEVPVGLAILIYASTTVAGALSFLPGGLLVTEAAMTILLVEASSGFDEPTAVAATILIRLATLWFAVLLGGVALAVLKRRFLDVAIDDLADGRALDAADEATDDSAGDEAANDPPG